MNTSWQLQTTPPISSTTKQVQPRSPERRCGLSRAEFERDYVLARRPVILTDATQNWAARNWTPENLVERLGDRLITIRTPTGQNERSFTELTREILLSTPEAPAVYGRNINVAEELPELLPDIQPRLTFAQPDWLSSRWLPKNFIFPHHFEELFYGGAGAGFSTLHVDYWGMDGFVNQLYGTKDFVAFSPDDSPYLYPDPAEELNSQILDLDNPDLETFPLFAQATPYRFRLHPGETFYMPNGWWHATTMTEPSITLITSTWNRGNWPIFLQEYRKRAALGKLKRLIMFGYLRALGWGLGTWEQLTGHSRIPE